MTILFLLCLILFWRLDKWIVTTDILKQYLIVQQHKIQVDEDNPYLLFLPFCGLSYYTSVSIQKVIAVHDQYLITFWGCRKSRKWRFLMDEHFEITPIIDREKGRYYQPIDAELIKIFNDKVN